MLIYKPISYLGEHGSTGAYMRQETGGENVLDRISGMRYVYTHYVACELHDEYRRHDAVIYDDAHDDV